MALTYAAKDSFSAMHDGHHVYVRRGDTTVEGHWLLDAHREAFAPLKVTHPLPVAPEPVSKPARKSEPAGAAK